MKLFKIKVEKYEFENKKKILIIHRIKYFVLKINIPLNQDIVKT